MKMAKLRRMLTHPRKNESGQGALAIVLLLLMLGAVILTPLLVFMSTGVKAGQVYESKLQEFYAADAGVEDAIWKIKDGTSGAAYFLGEEVNDRNVSVTIQDKGGGLYKINSTATSDTGGNTTIECYYGALDYSSLLDNAITSDGTVDLLGKVNVTGNISTPNCEGAGYTPCDCPNYNYSADCPNCTKCCSEEPLSWPTAETLSQYYYNKVKDYPYSGEDINIATNPERGPLYKNGTLNIYSGSKDKNASLNGTVYVTGDTKIGSTTGTSRNFTLNLSKQTIFVESNSTGSGKEALKVTREVTITGSGCIIAVGDVYFAPDGDVGSPDNFVLIMSVTGTVTLRPSGTFYGAIVGKDTVMEQSGVNASVTSTGYDEGIDFPIGQSKKIVLSYTLK